MGNGYPYEGQFFLQNDFNGPAGSYNELYQDIAIPAGAASVMLRWSERIQWDLLESGGSLPREYAVTVQPAGGGPPLATLYSMSVMPSTFGDTGYVEHEVDLLSVDSGIAGQTVRINFRQDIPEDWIGTSQCDLDAISLTYDWADYDVYFGTTNPPTTLVAEGIDTPVYEPGLLTEYTDYYWQVVAHGDCDDTIGHVWPFTTGAMPRIHVDAAAGGNDDGKTWDDAYRFLQDALAEATGVADYAPVEIAVAGNVYLPDRSSAQPAGSNDPTVSFALIENVSLRGGYAGTGQPDPDQRDLELYETTLSGDIGTPGDEADNSYHVVSADAVDATAVIDGFTITAGMATGAYPHSEGGGMAHTNSTATVTDCIFTGNRATYGAGMHSVNSSPIMNRCSFTSNVATYYGGGMLNRADSHPSVSNCTFAGNRADKGGAAMFNKDTNPHVSNCTIVGNIVGQFGAAMSNGNAGSPTVSNSIFWANADSTDGDEAMQIDGGEPLLLYNCIQGWTGLLGGIGNIGEDPRFVDPGHWDDNSTPADATDDFWVAGDYHLRSLGWRWDRDNQEWMYDRLTSRCIDAGNPGDPLGQELLTVPDDPDNEWGENLRINMGVYGGIDEASIAPYDWALLADINNDGTSDTADLGLFLGSWLGVGQGQYADFDRDGDVDLVDFAVLGADWLGTTSWHVP